MVSFADNICRLHVRTPPHFSLQHYPRIRTTRGNLFERIWARRAEDCRVSFLISYSNPVCKAARRLRRDTPSKQIRAKQAHEEGERKGLRMFKCPACTAEAASRLLSPVLRKHQEGEGRGVPKGTREREALNTGWQEEVIVSALLVAKRHVDVAKCSRCYLGPAHL